RHFTMVPGCDQRRGPCREGGGDGTSRHQRGRDPATYPWRDREPLHPRRMKRDRKLSLEVGSTRRPFHDGPLIFDNIAANTKESIVQVYGGVAVGRDQAEPIAETDLFVMHG